MVAVPAGPSSALDDFIARVPVPLLAIPLAALVAGRAVLSDREEKKKEIESEISAAEKRKKELSSSNALVFVSFKDVSFALYRCIAYSHNSPFCV